MDWHREGFRLQVANGGTWLHFYCGPLYLLLRRDVLEFTLGRLYVQLAIWGITGWWTIHKGTESPSGAATDYLARGAHWWFERRKGVHFARDVDYGHWG